ncbi:Serine-threonine/tyrosine-protein kinase, catalytic domain [Dillenia turbinata]|uniref:Serine-threonine/tyrosine-protein kinase, catalytic domain n=1 Tax=Dillenia turbinata TaxID=194707 RepID=A0AAN8UL06_9MAGN
MKEAKSLSRVGNILLDEDMNPKISDFGLARTFLRSQVSGKTHRVVGTLIFSETTDVFSFGVLLLEIVTGKKNTSHCIYDQSLNLVGYAKAWHLWNGGGALELMDQELDALIVHVRSAERHTCGASVCKTIPNIGQQCQE